MPKRDASVVSPESAGRWAFRGISRSPATLYCYAKSPRIPIVPRFAGDSACAYSCTVSTTRPNSPASASTPAKWRSGLLVAAIRSALSPLRPTTRAGVFTTTTVAASIEPNKGRETVRNHPRPQSTERHSGCLLTPAAAPACCISSPSLSAASLSCCVRSFGDRRLSSPSNPPSSPPPSRCSSPPSPVHPPGCIFRTSR